jgi:hypothetical protein
VAFLTQQLSNYHSQKVFGSHEAWIPQVNGHARPSSPQRVESAVFPYDILFYAENSVETRVHL